MSPRTSRAAAARPVSTASSHERDAPAFDETVDASHGARHSSAPVSLIADYLTGRRISYSFTCHP